MGSGTKRAPIVTVRLVEVRSGKTWHSYLTSVLDPQILPPYVVADLDRRRWRIESAFCTVKPLLNLSYLWTGSLHKVQLQIGETWLFYAILVDSGDGVAEELEIPFEQIYLEIIYRGMYHFYLTYQKELAFDPVEYLASPQNRDLRIFKRGRKPINPLVSPFFAKTRSREQFFFQPP